MRRGFDCSVLMILPKGFVFAFDSLPLVFSSPVLAPKAVLTSIYPAVFYTSSSSKWDPPLPGQNRKTGGQRCRLGDVGRFSGWRSLSSYRYYSRYESPARTSPLPMPRRNVPQELRRPAGAPY